MSEQTIPNDVLAAAKLAAYSCEALGHGNVALTSQIGVRVVCEAILAERKAERSRCNEILRDAWGKQLSLDAIDDGFLARLVENAFSWALQQTNYLDPKHALRLVEATRNGMKAEEAAVWRSDTPEREARKARLAAAEVEAIEAETFKKHAEENGL